MRVRSPSTSPTPAARTPGAATWEFFAGVAFGFGGKPKDTDKDLVPDKADGCPDTPLGCLVDARGCPLDGDKDGVCDGLDKCPGTPKGCRWMRRLSLRHRSRRGL